MTWQPIETAPRNKPVRLLVGRATVAAEWQAGFLNDSNEGCSCWVCVDEDWPESWTDGVHWALNEDGEPSANPTSWQPLPDPPEAA